MEQEEIDLLLGDGYSFTTQFLGKTVTWSIGKMTLGKMVKLSKIFIKLQINEDDIMSEDLRIQIPAQYEAVRKNANFCAEILATAVESWIPKNLLKRHFLNSVDANELSKFAVELLKFSNYQNFMTSIVLMNGNRPTKATPIE